MANKKEINDALSQKLGDFFQYYIAALDFFENDDVDKITIEKHGDITIYKGMKTIQKEVKHHINSTNLTNKDLDFWKTFYNWIVEKDNSLKYDELILFTTECPSINGIFEGWNNETPENKYDKLIGLDHGNKTETKNFDYYYDSIFNGDIDKKTLIEIISRIKIIQGSNNIYAVSKNFYKYFYFLNDDDKNSIVSWLVGYLIGEASTQSDDWTIKKEDFMLQTKKLVSLMMNENFGIPSDFLECTLSNDVIDNYKNYPFVKKINEISLDNEVVNAVNDYWKTQSTIQHYFSENISMIQRIKTYNAEMENILKNSMEYEKCYVDNNDELDILKKSRGFYYKMMGLSLINVDGWNNRVFFQKGTIHTILDETDIRWYLGDKDEDK